MAEGDIVAKKFLLHKVLGQGSFGKIFLSTNIKTQEEVA